MKRLALPVLLSLLLALLLSACGGSGGASLGSGDVLVVGGQAVPKDDLAAVLNGYKKQFEANKQKFPKPGTREYNALQTQAMNVLLQRAEVEQKGADMGIKVSSKDVQDRLNLIRTQSYGNSEKKLEDSLKQQGVTLDQYKHAIEVQILSERIFKKLTDSVHVSDAAIKQYYDQNPSLYKQNSSRDVRHILVPSKSLADSLYGQLVAAHEKNFAALAKKYSKDPSSAANGGKLTVVKGKQVPQFDRVAFSLKTGQIAKPVKSSYGWHIIQALSPIRPPGLISLGKVKETIRQTLDQQKKNEVVTKWFTDVQKTFCKSGSIKYQVGYQPNPDPCTSLLSATTATQ
jgi:foldase protein PrsA